MKLGGVVYVKELLPRFMCIISLVGKENTPLSVDLGEHQRFKWVRIWAIIIRN